MEIVAGVVVKSQYRYRVWRIWTCHCRLLVKNRGQASRGRWGSEEAVLVVMRREVDPAEEAMEEACCESQKKAEVDDCLGELLKGQSGHFQARGGSDHLLASSSVGCHHRQAIDGDWYHTDTCHSKMRRLLEGVEEEQRSRSCGIARSQLGLRGTCQSTSGQDTGVRASVAERPIDVEVEKDAKKQGEVKQMNAPSQVHQQQTTGPDLESPRPCALRPKMAACKQPLRSCRGPKTPSQQPKAAKSSVQIARRA